MIPISGLSEEYHMLLFFMILSLILTIVAVLVFPRVFGFDKETDMDLLNTEEFRNILNIIEFVQLEIVE